MRLLSNKTYAALALMLSMTAASADDAAPDSLTVSAGIEGVWASGDFAPHLMAANRYGTLTSSRDILLNASVSAAGGNAAKLRWSAGVQAYGGYASGIAYDQYSGDSWQSNTRRPASIRLQQLYLTLRHRALGLEAGMRQRTQLWSDNDLGSGDLVESNNARPLPQIRIGIPRYTAVPWTRGIMDIRMELGYGKFVDKRWLEDRYNRYSSHINYGQWINFKNIHFRFLNNRRASFEAGAQAVTIFGGVTEYYSADNVWRRRGSRPNLKSFVRAILPGGGEDFRYGNTLGSWDLAFNYRLSGGERLRAYAQLPWEDGSGMDKRNGWDGLWGISYYRASGSLVEGIVLEYLDLTNQSGPIHWSPSDFPSTTITSHATGADDYYNNATTNTYANYGMMMGTPLVLGPVYNIDGFPQSIATRVRGVHVATRGMLSPQWQWNAAVQWRKAYGSGYVYFERPRHAWSVMMRLAYTPSSYRGWQAFACMALDRGQLPANAFGVSAGVTYTLDLSRR